MSHFSEVLVPCSNSLHTLDLKLIIDSYMKIVDNSASQLRDASRAIARLTCLRILRLRGGEPAKGIDLSSASLEIVDCRKTRKCFVLNFVNCPKLRELHVADTGYGNGIRRLGSDGYRICQEIKSEDYRGEKNPLPVRIRALGNTWVNAIQSTVWTRVRLPDQCDVIFYGPTSDDWELLE